MEIERKDNTMKCWLFIILVALFSFSCTSGSEDKVSDDEFLISILLNSPFDFCIRLYDPKTKKINAKRKDYYVENLRITHLSLNCKYLHTDPAVSILDFAGNNYRYAIASTDLFVYEQNKCFENCDYLTDKFLNSAKCLNLIINSDSIFVYDSNLYSLKSKNLFSLVDVVYDSIQKMEHVTPKILHRYRKQLIHFSKPTVTNSAVNFIEERIYCSKYRFYNGRNALLMIEFFNENDSTYLKSTLINRENYNFYRF